MRWHFPYNKRGICFIQEIQIKFQKQKKKQKTTDKMNVNRYELGPICFQSIFG